MARRYPIWKDPSWLPYCWAILIFFCSRVVVVLGLVFSQKYVPSSIERWSGAGTTLRRLGRASASELSNSEALVRRHLTAGVHERLEHDCRNPSARLHARDVRLTEDRPNRAHVLSVFCPFCIDEVASCSSL